MYYWATTAADVFTETNGETNFTTDAHAGFSARDIEVASAESVANANIFQGLWLSSDDSVSCAPETAARAAAEPMRRLLMFILTSSQV
jgi:hypothetical protein